MTGNVQFSLFFIFCAFTSGCSVDDWKGGGQVAGVSKSEKTSANVSAQEPDIVLEVTGAPKDGIVVNDNTLKFETVLKLAHFSPTVEKYLINQVGATVSAIGPDGMEFFKKTSKRTSESWMLTLNKGDGKYQILVSPEVPDTLKLKSSDVSRLNVFLDTAAPQVAINGLVESDLQKGVRRLTVTVVTSKVSAKCGPVGVERSMLPPQSLQLQEDAPDSEKPLGLKYKAGPLELEGKMDDVTLSVECKDAAGNVASAKKVAGTLPIGNVMPMIKTPFVSALPVTFANNTVIESKSSEKLLFVRRDQGKEAKLPLELSAIDSQQQVIKGTFAEKAASGAKVFVIFKPNEPIEQTALLVPKTMADLNSPDLAKYLQGPIQFGTNFDAVISPLTIAELPQRLHVVIAGFGADSSSIQVFPFTFMVDEKGPEVGFTLKTAVVEPEKGTLLPVAAKILSHSGAPLKGTYIFEATNDDQSWSEVGMTDLKISGSDISAKIAYPGSANRPVRLRIKGTDLAGNAVVSEVSAGLSLGTIGDRVPLPACVSKAEIVMKPVWRVGCRLPTRDSAGKVISLSQEVYMPFYVRNLGTQEGSSDHVNFTFGYDFLSANDTSAMNLTKETVAMSPRLPTPMGERLLLSGNERITSTMFGYIAIPPGVLALKNISLVPNIESYIKIDRTRDPAVESLDRRPSISNACDATSTRVALWADLGLQVSPYPCDVLPSL